MSIEKCHPHLMLRLVAARYLAQYMLGSRVCCLSDQCMLSLCVVVVVALHCSRSTAK